MNRRVILLGKTGNGKSSTGNLILGAVVFKSKKSASSVTSKCEVYTKEREDNVYFAVCDTPGLFCNGEDPIEMALKIQKSVDLCPNPHAFLLVFSGGRMTTDEKYTIDLLRVIFGDKMFDHCIVVITRGNEFKTDSEFDAFWKESDELKAIVKKCGNRVVKIENDPEKYENSGLDRLLEMIEQLAKNGNYDNIFLKTHKDVIQEYKHKYGVSKSEDIDNHLDTILKTLEKRLEEVEKRQKEKERKLLEDRKKFEEEKRKAEEERKELIKQVRIMNEKIMKLEEEKIKAKEEEKERRKYEECRLKQVEQQLNEAKIKMEEDEAKRRHEFDLAWQTIVDKHANENKRMKEEEDNRRKEQEREFERIAKENAEAIKQMRQAEFNRRQEVEEEMNAREERFKEEKRKLEEKVNDNHCIIL